MRRAAVFIDTGLEYPEIRDFVKTIGNVIWIKPTMPFGAVISKYGYPVASKDVAQKVSEIRNTNSDKLRNKRLFGDDAGNGKLPLKWRSLIMAPFKVSHKCCDVMKKRPAHAYEKQTGRKPMVGTMACDSNLRKTMYLRRGCNFIGTRSSSMPMAFWRDVDVWDYIRSRNISYSKIYDMGYSRTGCMFCMFGVHMEKEENRFQRMKRTHPKQYNYCINKMGCGDVLNYISVDY